MPFPDYRGRYPFFDFAAVTTYPLKTRVNKVSAATMLKPDALLAETQSRFTSPALTTLVQAILAARKHKKPVMLFTGAHLVKNGFGLLMIDLMRRGFVTLIATNAAGLTHDLELAYIGETSEYVPNALPAGTFGMCKETPDLMNRAFRAGYDRGWGGGESLGRLILGEPILGDPHPAKIEFPYPDLSIAAAGIRYGVPVTMHAGLGTDIIDQHACFDPAAKGGASGFDFGIFTAQACQLGASAPGQPAGVVLNIGSSVQGPEVFLKAVSMAANVGKPPTGLTAASFDLRPVQDADVN
ncbi:MAG TPA: hypothetical protein VL860_11995, partial [Planctomycetota bacterium]|nr:hypothetical protein [Planctomycetota bacterium]